MSSHEDFQIMNIQKAIDFALECVRSGILINGGAVVALLAFLGGSNNKIIDSAYIHTTMTWFCFGIICAVLGGVSGYLSQVQHAGVSSRLSVGRAPNGNPARFLTIFGILLVLGSIACFVLGTYFASSALFPTKL